MNSTNPVITPDGTHHWYLNDQLHRIDGPAIIYSGGTQQWYVGGKLHRTDGPAVIAPNGTQQWYVGGKFHRIDGPAIIYPNGTQTWWLNDTKYRTPKEYQKAANISNEDMTILLLKYNFPSNQQALQNT